MCSYNRNGKTIKKLFVRDKGRCKYCNQKVIPVRFLIAKNIFFVELAHYVAFVLNGRTIELSRATIDHVIPRKKDRKKYIGVDRNHEDNLVLCCSKCNHIKDLTPPRNPKVNEYIGRYCIICGNHAKINKILCGYCNNR